jgi:hypothetical protein
VIRRHFATHAELERQVAAARAVPAEILAGALCIFHALAGALAGLQHKWFGRPRTGHAAPDSPGPGGHHEQRPRRDRIMKPLSTNHAIWLAQGVALGIVVRLLQRGLRASCRQLRYSGLANRLRVIGLARRRLSEG